MIVDLSTQAYNALRHNRRRSVLTMLGMAWGIATVVLLLAYGTGFERGLWSAFRSFGTNLVFIFPGRTELQAGGTKAGTQVRLTVNDLGENLRLDGISYQIVGVLKHQVQNGDDNINEHVYVPFSAMSDLINTYYLSAVVMEYEGDHAKVVKAVRDSMAFHHSFDPKDKRAVFVFDVFADLMDLRVITTGIKILLGFIGLLTLGIGG